MFCGPLGVERKLKLGEGWLPYEWSRTSLYLCKSNKLSFFMSIGEALDQFDPYFEDLLPLARDWTNLLRFNFAATFAEGEVERHNPVLFDEIIRVLEKHIALLPDNESSPEHVFRKRVVDRNITDILDKKGIIDSIVKKEAIRGNAVRIQLYEMHTTFQSNTKIEDKHCNIDPDKDVKQGLEVIRKVLLDMLERYSL
ncbi:hypothetical protein BD769DRAFT_1387680 [Suillus cothurnatus]|nr:hypothetical protein BD769DRAFT_1387680 [Suillus cothurnatus]